VGASLTPARALALGVVTVGVLDGLDAVIYFGLRGVSPVRIFQAIAAGLLGRAAFQGGAATALLGGALHFTIAFAIVSVYFIASRRIASLVRHPFVWGPVYGVAVYLTMNLVVIPLSAAVRPTPALPTIVNGLMIHVFGVGIPAALCARAAHRNRGGSGPLAGAGAPPATLRS
jgi:hypothetical protein